MSNKRLFFLILLTVCCLPISASAGDFKENLARIEKMTPAQRTQLEKNAQRYQQMTTAEKKRYRELHQAIQTDQDLQKTFRIYSNWLQTISPWQRELLAQPQSASRRVSEANEILKEAEELDEIRAVLKQSGPKRRPSLSPEEVSVILIPMVEKLNLTSTQQGFVDSLPANPTPEELQDHNIRYLRWGLEQHRKTLKEKDASSFLFSPKIVREMIQRIPENKDKIHKRLNSGIPERRQHEIFFQELRNVFEAHYRNLKPGHPTMDELTKVYKKLPRPTQLDVLSHQRIAKRLMDYYWLNPDLGEIHRLKVDSRFGKRGRGPGGKRKLLQNRPEN